MHAAEVLEARTLLTTYTVDTLEDAIVVDGKVSLREAVLAANANAAVGDAAAGSSGIIDSINLDRSLAGGAITLGGSELLITEQLGISNLSNVHVTVDAGGLSRVFAVAAGVEASIHGLTLTRGRTGGGAPGVGGGVFNRGRLTLSDVAVTASVAAGEGAVGGGVYNEGTLRLIESVVNGNSSGGVGGGVVNATGGTLTVEGTSISGNAAVNRGGGIYNGYQGTVTVEDSLISGNALQRERGGGVYNAGDFVGVNVTVSGNVTGDYGGGFAQANSGSATLRNATVVGNRAFAYSGPGEGGSGGIFGSATSSAPFTIHNTLVVGNYSGGRDIQMSDDLTFGGFTSDSSHNVTGSSSIPGVANGTNGNIVGADWRTVVDPVLRYNGGRLPTHALIPGSIAIDAGDDALAVDAQGHRLFTDQRGLGFARVRQARVDVGAFEAAPADDLVGYAARQWYVGASDGSSFNTALWGEWADAAWDALRHGDFDGDGRSDVLGLIDGDWYVGLSTGTGYATSLWADWKAVDWRNVRVGDLNFDGKDDILANVGGQWWAALSTGTGFGPASVWATWADAAWDFFALEDTSADGKADLIGYLDGEWWVALSTGTGIATATLWERWTDVPWQALGTFDVNGDGSADVYGLYQGRSYYGMSLDGGAFQFRSPRFATGLHGVWDNRDWRDVRAGDFDGDGVRNDLAARSDGEWWVLESFLTRVDTRVQDEPRTPRPTTARLWATWADVDWQDVVVGDFDGNGLTDLAGRFQGDWYVAHSTGTSFTTSLWERWSEADWKAVAAADATGPQAVASGSGDEPLALFWSQADEDGEFADSLAAV